MFIIFDTSREVSSLKYVRYGNIHLVDHLARGTAFSSLERILNASRKKYFYDSRLFLKPPGGLLRNYAVTTVVSNHSQNSFPTEANLIQAMDCF